MICHNGKLALSEEKLNDCKLLAFEWVNEGLTTAFEQNRLVPHCHYL
jgi:hypothetical protein